MGSPMNGVEDRVPPGERHALEGVADDARGDEAQRVVGAAGEHRQPPEDGVPADEEQDGAAEQEHEHAGDPGARAVQIGHAPHRRRQHRGAQGRQRARRRRSPRIPGRAPGRGTARGTPDRRRRRDSRRGRTTRSGGSAGCAAGRRRLSGASAPWYGVSRIMARRGRRHDVDREAEQEDGLHAEALGEVAAEQRRDDQAERVRAEDDGEVARDPRRLGLAGTRRT